MLVLLLASCGAEKHPEQPWKGYWYAVTSNPGGDGGNKLYVRLDFYDSTVCVDGYENVLGVLIMTKDRSVYTPVAVDLITSSTYRVPRRRASTTSSRSRGNCAPVRLNAPPTARLLFWTAKCSEPASPG